MLADLAHQALCQDAVQRGDEIVQIDVHVEKPPEHIDDVVGVHSGEHQVTGECRLNGDLGGFFVANLADHHLVGVVTQDRA